MKSALAILGFLIAVSAGAQVSNPSIILVSVAPSGACAVGLPDQQVSSTGVIYTCQNGVWSPSSTSPAGPVNPATYGAKFDTRFFNDGSTTSGQNTLTSATLACTSADVGKLALVVNPTTHAYPFGTGLVTVQSCTSSTIAVLSANATETDTGTLNWAIGTDDTAALTNAVDAAWGNNRSVELPCGATIITGRPFVWTTQKILSQTYGLHGCAGTNQTMFFLHPQVTSAIQTGGTVFYSPPTATGAIGWQPAGFFYNRGLSDFIVTSFDGNLPFASGAAHILDPQDNIFNVALFNIYETGAAACYSVVAQTGETKISRLNLQHSNCIGAYIGGQGINTISDSIFAYLGNYSIACTGSSECSLINDYVTVNSGGGCNIQNCNILIGSNSILNIYGGVYSINSGGDIIDTPSGSTKTIVNIDGAQFTGNTVTKIVNLADSSVSVHAKNTVFDVQAATGTGNFYDQGGNTMTAVASTVNLIADGHSAHGACTGAATASSTLGLYGTGGNVTATTCTSTTIGSGIVVAGTRTLQNLVVHAGTGGVNASSGVVTVLKNGVATAITCTLGTGTSCTDGTHTVTTANGDLISIEFTTQTADTLANVNAVVEWN